MWCGVYPVERTMMNFARGKMGIRNVLDGLFAEERDWNYWGRKRKEALRSKPSRSKQSRSV